MINEEQLLESKETREKLVDRIEVLNKVKELLLIPQTELATIKQVADYYEVETRTIERIFALNRDEIESDGCILKSYKDFKTEIDVGLEMSKGKATFIFKNGEILDVPMRGLRVFPRRAILRIGMLLTGSEISKRIRTALLDIEESVPIEIKTQEIDKEKSLMYDIVDKCLEGKTTETIAAISNLMDYKNRHIKMQEQHIEKLQQDNKALAGEILTWEDRSKINFAIRKLATMLHKPHGYVWNDLYKELKYGYHIDVKLRGDKPYINHIKENEWNKVIQTFSALCETNNISPSDILSNLEESEGGQDNE